MAPGIGKVFFSLTTGLDQMKVGRKDLVPLGETLPESQRAQAIDPELLKLYLYHTS